VFGPSLLRALEGAVHMRWRHPEQNLGPPSCRMSRMSRTRPSFGDTRGGVSSPVGLLASRGAGLNFLNCWHAEARGKCKREERAWVAQSFWAKHSRVARASNSGFCRQNTKNESTRNHLTPFFYLLLSPKDMEHPLSLESSPAERRALKFKVSRFGYGILLFFLTHPFHQQSSLLSTGNGSPTRARLISTIWWSGP
jgi:hypothetical protein